ncbi:hypothetical protein KR074_001960 [Drosophila pseudoananassae]|nr:hypothetical protein KR074_001960 [Drosophila pseudoananassae]
MPCQPCCAPACCGTCNNVTCYGPHSPPAVLRRPSRATPSPGMCCPPLPEGGVSDPQV